MHRPAAGEDRLTRGAEDPRRAAALPYFFYGTLVDLDLLARVAGEPITPCQVGGASVAGYRRTGVIGRSYPILMHRASGRVEGVLVHGLTSRARERIDAYEGDNYRLARATVTDSRGGPRPVTIYLFVGARSGLRSDRRPWRLEVWQRRWKRRALRRAGRLGRLGRRGRGGTAVWLINAPPSGSYRS